MKQTIIMPNEFVADVLVVNYQLGQLVNFEIEETFEDKHYPILYSYMKQAKVLKQVAIAGISQSKSYKEQKIYADALNELEYHTFPFADYNLDELEVCPEAENLKIKYAEFLNNKSDEISIN